MLPEEALEALDGYKAEKYGKINTAITVAQAALTKEVPLAPLPRKRVGKKAIERIWRCPCPGCDEAHGHVFTASEVARKIRRCPECGQRIDWDEHS